MPNRRPPASRFAALAAACCALAGCARYQVGSGSLYAPDVQTVYVPMIESQSFRRDIGERLTEAVCKEIELKTPFKVVADPSADAQLTIRVLNDYRGVQAEDPFDAPRVAASSVSVEVTFLNRRRLPIGPPQTIALPASLIEVTKTAPLIPAGGQSVTTSQQDAIARLAQQIVGTMEEPW